MPTAARLVAALVLGLLGMIASEMIKPLMPESTDFGYFTLLNGGLGFAVGWRVLGMRVGHGLVNAINIGITAVISLVLLGLFVQAVNEMLRVALRSRYKSPLDAFRAVIDLMLEYGLILMNFQIISTLLVGGILAGLLAEFAWRRWR